MTKITIDKKNKTVFSYTNIRTPLTFSEDLKSSISIGENINHANTK
jgi:hypothetical protein